MTVKPKNAAKDVDGFVKEIGNFTLDAIYDRNEKIRKLNLPKLVTVLVQSTLNLAGTDPSGNNVTYSAEERIKIDTFTRNFIVTVEHFMDFLDYDQDNQVKLVEFTKENERLQVEIGKDLQKFISDVKNIGTFKQGATVSEKIVTALSKLLNFLLADENLQETVKDFGLFYSSVKVTFNSMKELKNINYMRVFSSRIDDIVSFIIMFCVVLIPVIDLVTKKIEELNVKDAKTEVNGGEVVSPVNDRQIRITNDEIMDAVVTTYGDHLDLVLSMVTNITNKMMTFLSSSRWEKIKQKCCCCCANDNKQ